VGGQHVGREIVTELRAPGGPYTGDAGEVEDGVRIDQQWVDRAVEEVGGDVVVPRDAVKGSEVGHGRGVGGGVAAVNADDGGAGLDKGVGEVGADESGGAGHHSAARGGGRVLLVLWHGNLQGSG
jgi:hypothetical protein